MQEEAKLVLERQHEHFMKLLDLFETRQTQAFNFAFVAYAGGISAFGLLVDKLYSNGAADYFHVVAIVLVISVALPVVLLPLCFLYADVSVFCAALNEGNIRHCNRLLAGASPRFIGPGRLAFDWLCEAGAHHRQSAAGRAAERLACDGGRARPASRSAGDLDIEWVANSRVSLFYIAPLFGLAVCLWAICMLVNHPEVFNHAGFVLTCGSGVVVSVCSLVFTWKACRKTRLARNASHPGNASASGPG